MKIIHCADLHLDSKMTSFLSRDKAKERKAELLVTFTRMVNYAVSEGVSAILIAGDLFDTKLISVHAKNVVSDVILTHPGITFYYLRGNHDAEDLLNGFSEIPSNLKLFDIEWKSYRLSDRVVLHGVEFDKENANRVQSDFYPDPSKINIVMLHGQESEALSKDKTEVINLNLFKNKGIDYLALGHVHKYKAEMLDGRCRYCYSGCLEGRGFDECGPHGFVLLDIDEGERKVKDSFVPFASRTLYEINCDISQDHTSTSILDSINKALDESGALPKDLVKIVLSGSVDINCEKDVVFLEKSLEGRFYHLKIKDETTLYVDYDSYLLDETLKGEFVRVVKSKDMNDEQKAGIIRLGLSMIAGGNVEG